MESDIIDGNEKCTNGECHCETILDALSLLYALLMAIGETI
jgi:hypothetical protein